VPLSENNFNLNYVSVDFSLNSPGICIYQEDTNKYHFISYIKEGQGTKKERAWQEDISHLDGVTLIHQPDWGKHQDYSSVELAKIRRYSQTADDIINLILNITNTKKQYIISFEGTSFGSKMGTNNIIDMAAGAAILKERMLSQLQILDIQTIAPTTIKKHAGKGNMNNVLEDQVLAEHPLLDFCVKEIGPSKKIPKPFDDLVDAYFLTNFVRAKMSAAEE
jgi:hypothetical protein